jgi:hypothetical protein
MKLETRWALLAAGLAAVTCALAVQPGTVIAPHTTDATKILPVSASSKWFTVITAGGMDDQDAATITNPTTEITLSTRNIVLRGWQDDGTDGPNEGVLLIVRLAYDDGLTSITDPVIKVFGRDNDDEVWTLLETVGGTVTATIATAATDVTDGTMLYTTPDLSADAWDTQGCRQILIGVETALAGTGTVTTAYLQAKLL